MTVAFVTKRHPADLAYAPGLSQTGACPSGSAPERISDATSGAAYKHADGFDEVNGDYGEIAITNRVKSIGTWGEGLSYDGPGRVWFNRQT